MSDPVFENKGDIITRTIEECAEVIHILCKIRRFGWHTFHPDDPNKTPNHILATNEIDDLEKRLSELKVVILSKILTTCPFDTSHGCSASVCHDSSIECSCRDELGRPRYI